MLQRYLIPVSLILLFCLPGCASGPKVDMKRFSEAQALLAKMPRPAKAQTVDPLILNKEALPENTSGGSFKALEDVCKQDAAVAAHYPILRHDFNLLKRAVRRNEETDSGNASDYDQAITDLQKVFDDIIIEEKKGSRWNPFK